MHFKDFLNNENEEVLIEIPVIKEQEKKAMEMVLTNRRVIFFQKNNKQYIYQDIPIEHVSSVQFQCSDKNSGSLNIYSGDSRPTISILIEQQELITSMVKFIQQVYFVRDSQNSQISVVKEVDTYTPPINVKSETAPTSVYDIIKPTKTVESAVAELKTESIKIVSEKSKASVPSRISEGTKPVEMEPIEMELEAKENVEASEKLRLGLFKRSKEEKIEKTFESEEKAPQIKDEDKDWFKAFAQEAAKQIDEKIKKEENEKEEDKTEEGKSVEKGIEEVKKEKEKILEKPIETAQLETALVKIEPNDTVIEEIECEICGNKMAKSVKFCNKCGTPMK